jgi:hypothetical protein
VAINYAKFRTFFDAAPLGFYSQVQSNPQRLGRVAGKQVSLGNVRSGAGAYLSPGRIEFRPTFPWVFATRNARVYPEARYDLIEPYAGLPASNPAAFVLALAGVVGAAWLLRRRSILWPSILIIGGLAGAAAPLAADALTFRYLHDMFPFLVVAGAFGLHSLLGLPRFARRLAFALLLPAALFGIWANLAIAIVYQRVIVNGTPGDCRREFRAWQQYIDRQIRIRPSVGSTQSACTREGRRPHEVAEPPKSLSLCRGFELKLLLSGQADIHLFGANPLAGSRGRHFARLQQICDGRSQNVAGIGHAFLGRLAVVHDVRQLHAAAIPLAVLKPDHDLVPFDDFPRPLQEFRIERTSNRLAPGLLTTCRILFRCRGHMRLSPFRCGPGPTGSRRPPS